VPSGGGGGGEDAFLESQHQNIVTTLSLRDDSPKHNDHDDEATARHDAQEKDYLRPVMMRVRSDECKEGSPMICG